MNIRLELVGELNEMQDVLNILVGGTKSNAPAAKAAATAAAAKKQAETAEGSEESEKAPTPAAAPAKKAAAPAAKAQAPKAAAPAKKAAVLSDEDKVAEMEALETSEEQLAHVQADVTKLTKKGRTADVKKLLAIYDSPKVSELDPAVYGDFYGLVLRLAGGEAADDIVESFGV